MKKQLEEQKDVNAVFEKDLATQKKAYTDLTNSLTQVSANLAQVSGTLSKTEEALKNTQQEVAKRDAQISELQTQNQALENRALELSTSITNLTLQIAETQRKLAASEGDKGFLQKELRRLMTQKADLERQFNDLTALRAQVAKLKQERNLARRLEWMRQGLLATTEQKGAQKLMLGFQVAQTKTSKPASDLNVEASTAGSVRVIPPIKSADALPAK